MNMPQKEGGDIMRKLTLRELSLAACVTIAMAASGCVQPETTNEPSGEQSSAGTLFDDVTMSIVDSAGETRTLIFDKEVMGRSVKIKDPAIVREVKVLWTDDLYRFSEGGFNGDALCKLAGYEGGFVEESTETSVKSSSKVNFSPSSEVQFFDAEYSEAFVTAVQCLEKAALTTGTTPTAVCTCPDEAASCDDAEKFYTFENIAVSGLDVWSPPVAKQAAQFDALCAYLGQKLSPAMTLAYAGDHAEDPVTKDTVLTYVKPSGNELGFVLSQCDSTSRSYDVTCTYKKLTALGCKNASAQ
jgi:hypothetical protein